MELYAGIDLHGNNSVVTVLDEQDRTVYAKRVPNDLDAIVASLRACAGTVRGCWHGEAACRESPLGVRSAADVPWVAPRSNRQAGRASI